MTTLADLEKLPASLKKEVLNYAEYLLRTADRVKSPKKSKWLSIVERGTAKGKPASQTVIEMREEERW
jgi:hypothetical protein